MTIVLMLYKPPVKLPRYATLYIETNNIFLFTGVRLAPYLLPSAVLHRLRQSKKLIEKHGL